MVEGKRKQEGTGSEVCHWDIFSLPCPLWPLLQTFEAGACATAWPGPERHPGAWEDPKDAGPGAAFCARKGGWGGRAKGRKQAVIATCDCIWFVTAKAIIVFVELKREGRQMV